MLTMLRPYLLTALSFCLAAFGPPDKGELIEIQTWMNARSSAAFRPTDQNQIKIDGKIIMLPPKTQGKILSVQYFPQTRNYGLQVSLSNSPTGSAPVWIYYNVKNPGLRLLKGNQSDTKNVDEAKSAITLRETLALPEQKSAGAGRGFVWPPGVTSTQNLGQDVVQQISALNQVAREQINTSPQCRDCREKPAQYQTCDSKNSYFESQFDSINLSPDIANLISTPSRYPRVEACVRESMNISGGRFPVCQENDSTPSKYGPKACGSERLVRLVENSFSMSLDCFGGYLNGKEGDREALRETFRNTIALVNLESGFHLNSHSQTTAAGLGQMTDGTTDWINRTLWSELQNHMIRSENVSCQIMKDLKIEKSRPNRQYVCDRLGLSGGNPISNLLYTIGHLKLVRKEVQMVFDRKIREAGISLSSSERENFIGALTNWGHNTGAYGITRPLVSLLESEAGISALKEKNKSQFMELLKSEVSSFHKYYLKRQNLSEDRIAARAKEASEFHQYVQNKMNLLEGRVGRTCTL